MAETASDFAQGGLPLALTVGGFGARMGGCDGGYSHLGILLGDLMW